MFHPGKYSSCIDQRIEKLAFEPFFSHHFFRPRFFRIEFSGLIISTIVSCWLLLLFIVQIVFVVFRVALSG